VRTLAWAAHTAPEELDLWRVVDDVLDELHLEAQRSECRVTRGGAREVRGRWDRTLLEQSITNLLRNAFRFGAGKPVTIACEDLGDHASLTVSDEGPGIDPADQERIFERFERAVSSRRYGGLGLGLWVTREMVMRMGGAIRVRSAVGEGAAFTIELPKKGA
jgi:signal transduction histidine kinase